MQKIIGRMGVEKHCSGEGGNCDPVKNEKGKWEIGASA